MHTYGAHKFVCGEGVGGRFSVAFSAAPVLWIKDSTRSEKDRLVCGISEVACSGPSPV